MLVSRGPATTWDTMYQIFYRPFGYTLFGAFSSRPHLTAIAAGRVPGRRHPGLLRFPDGTPQLPALSPALALSLAWLLVWSYQRPWYDVMAICLLAVYPASRLDWLVLGRLILAAPVYLPGVPGPSRPGSTTPSTSSARSWPPCARLVAAVGFIVLCRLPGWWGWRGLRPGRGPSRGLRPPALQPLI